MAQPQRMLFLISVGYAISGPIVTLVLRKRKLQSRKS
jgi:CDP-diacylglycerol--serine O-phosphatidyltransferase